MSIICKCSNDECRALFISSTKYNELTSCPECGEGHKAQPPEQIKSLEDTLAVWKEAGTWPSGGMVCWQKCIRCGEIKPFPGVSSSMTCDGCLSRQYQFAELEHIKSKLAYDRRGNGSPIPVLQERYDALVAERDKLYNAIKKHHDQIADDRCWMDDDDLYKAAGLPPVDRRVGDTDAMLHNCRKFIANRCEGGGPWQSYIQLASNYQQLERSCMRQEEHIQQILGKALHYPLTQSNLSCDVDDYKSDGVCVGEHVAESIAAEAAQRIERLEKACAIFEKNSEDATKDWERVRTLRASIEKAIEYSRSIGSSNTMLILQKALKDAT